MARRQSSFINALPGHVGAEYCIVSRKLQSLKLQKDKCSWTRPISTVSNHANVECTTAACGVQSTSDVQESFAHRHISPALCSTCSCESSSLVTTASRQKSICNFLPQTVSRDRGSAAASRSFEHAAIFWRGAAGCRGVRLKLPQKSGALRQNM